MAFCTWHIKCVWSLCSCSYFRPCIQWMWNFVELSWEREEVSLANNGSFSRCKGRFFLAEVWSEAQCELFARRQRHCDAIPPTRGSFPEHIKREVYQGGVVWAQSDSCIRQVHVLHVPSHKHWDWMKERINDIWKPKLDFFDCRCILVSGNFEMQRRKSSCVGNCRCYRSGLPCTGCCIGNYQIIIR